MIDRQGGQSSTSREAFNVKALDVNGSEVIGSDGKLATGLAYVKQTVALADFTDGESTAGTVVLDDAIPVGAVVVQSLIDDVTGFAGDTSAVVTIGDGTDADRYNTGTPDVFTTAAAIAAGAVSGTAIHATEANVTVTVASAADFGDVTAGQMTITIFYYISA